MYVIQIGSLADPDPFYFGPPNTALPKTVKNHREKNISQKVIIKTVGTFYFSGRIRNRFFNETDPRTRIRIKMKRIRNTTNMYSTPAPSETSSYTPA